MMQISHFTNVNGGFAGAGAVLIDSPGKDSVVGKKAVSEVAALGGKQGSDFRGPRAIVRRSDESRLPPSPTRPDVVDLHRPYATRYFRGSTAARRPASACVN